jgi:hypothetical protein
MRKFFTRLTFIAACFALQPAIAQVQDTANAVTQTTETLQGTWDWTESRFASRGATPTLKTPATTSENISVTFKPGNMASVYVNKKFVGTYQYAVTQPMKENVMIRFKGNEGQPLPEVLQEGPLSIVDNEITIAGGYNDAGQNVKFRKTGTTPTKPVVAKKKAPAKKKKAPAKKKTAASKTTK